LYHDEFIGVLSITSIASEQREAKVDCPGVADGDGAGVIAGPAWSEASVKVKERAAKRFQAFILMSGRERHLSNPLLRS
jgi:hypothetical protein